MNDTNSGIHTQNAERQLTIRSDNLLDGLLFDTTGVPMPHRQTLKNGRINRHYVTKSKAASGEAPRMQERAPAWDIEAAVVRRVKAELIRQQAIVMAAGLLLKLHGEPLTQNDRDAKYVHGRLVETWDLLFPCERIRITKLLIERIDLTVDGFVVKWRDLPRSEFVSECANFSIFSQRSKQQPNSDLDTDPEIQSSISWVPLPPGLRTWRTAKPGKPD